MATDAPVKQTRTKADDPITGQSPAELTGGILTTGLLYDGRPVVRVVIEWEGGKLETALPTAEVEHETGSDLRDRIMRVLRNSPVPLTRKQVAGVMRRKGVGGRFSAEVSALLETFKIFERDKMLTDDETKYEAGD